jgi:hypothetical protein
MKKPILIILLVFFAVFHANAQYKNPTDGKSINRSTNNLILGIFNPKNFSMNHSFQVTMMSSRYGNVSLTSYINSMNYKVNDRMNVSADVKLQYSPYVSSSMGPAYAKNLQNDLNGLSLSRLSVDYKVSDNSFIKLEFRNMDGTYYNGYYDDYFFNKQYGY